MHPSSSAFLSPGLVYKALMHYITAVANGVSGKHVPTVYCAGAATLPSIFILSLCIILLFNCWIETSEACEDMYLYRVSCFLKCRFCDGLTRFLLSPSLLNDHARICKAHIHFNEYKKVV